MKNFLVKIDRSENYNYVNRYFSDLGDAIFYCCNIKHYRIAEIWDLSKNEMVAKGDYSQFRNGVFWKNDH